MNSLRIREARAADAGGVAAIINHEIRTGLAIWRDDARPVDDIRGLIESRLAKGHAAYVAEIEDEIIGWASYGEFRAYEGYARTMEHSVHIVPAHRRKGVARALMLRLLAHADAAGIHAMIGAIDASNTGSLALHEQLGFVEVGRMPEVGWKFGRWLTLVLMQRTAR